MMILGYWAFSHMEELIARETALIELLVVISLIALAARRLRVPYTVALVLGGLVVTRVQPLHGLELTHELILSLFVPPLVFEAAFHLDLGELRANLRPILVLALPGVLVTMLVVGGIVAVGTGIPLSMALVFGALIAATDPVAVVALFRELGVSRRLSLIIEGESLFNDGTGIVVFRAMLAIALAGQFNPVSNAVDFVWVSLGGVLIGTALGWLVSRVIARVDDHLIETTLTAALAYGSYLLAEQFHVSGVLAVVMAGLINGNLGPAGMSPTTKLVLFSFWEYAAFIANSLVFILIGLDIDLGLLRDNLWPILWAVAAVLASRALVIYPIGRWASWLLGSLPIAWHHVLFWGGLRGAVGLALALSLPDAVEPWRGTLQVMAFGVVLFTVLIKGTTMQWVLKWLGLTQRPTPERLELERRQGQLMALRAGWRRLEELHNDGVLSDQAWETLSAEYRARGQQVDGELRVLFAKHEELAHSEANHARREALRAERAALQEMLRAGLISQEVYEELLGKVDQHLGE